MPTKPPSTKEYAIPDDLSLLLTFHICWFGDVVDAVVMWNNIVSGKVQFAAKMLHAFRSTEKICNCCLWQFVWHVNVVAVADM